MSDASSRPQAAEIAKQLAAQLDERGQEYAIGGAIALGFWGAPRRRVELGDQGIWIWDAETLAVFKMMFFRRKDLAEFEQILRTQGAQLDREWVRCQIEEIHGKRDPRVAQGDELSREISA